MAKYRYGAIRRTNGLVLLCISPYEVYVQHHYGVNCYNRWFVKQRFFCQHNWKPFRRAVMNQRYVDLGFINRLAEKYEIDITGADEMPSLRGRRLRKVPEWGRDRNAH